MVAIRRPNKPKEGARGSVAVLDMSFSWFPRDGGIIGRFLHGTSRYARYQQQSVCLHSSILSFAMQHNGVAGEARDLFTQKIKWPQLGAKLRPKFESACREDGPARFLMWVRDPTKPLNSVLKSGSGLF
jgi:hypothetical protein